MTRATRIGIVGATGLVGSMMRSILQERSYPVDELRLYASSRSAGTKIAFGEGDIEVQDVANASFEGLDVVLLSAGADVSRSVAPRVAADGAVAVDNSSAWRMDDGVPLVVADVNDDDLTERPKGIIANPNCTTMIAMPVLRVLHRQAGLNRITVSTYQAVSGAGQQGVQELEEQLKQMQGGADDLAAGRFHAFPEPAVFPRTVANNVISLAGNLVDNETDEEHKFRNESRKILHLPDLDVTATCVRVPVYTGHSLSLVAEFDETISPEQAVELLSDAPGVRLFEVPTPLDAAGGDVSLVGRLRQAGHHPRRLAMFISGDNLRKGAALNTVQIAEQLSV